MNRSHTAPVDASTLNRFLESQMQPHLFRDYGPNGIQVEGKRPIFKIVSGVTASLALIEAAVAHEADAILVHHGLFWRGQEGRVTGWMRQRLALLLAHDLHLWAYHLPLDAHPTLGNNAQLGLRLGWAAQARFGEQDLGFIGRPADTDAGRPVYLDALQGRITAVLGRQALCISNDPQRPIERLAWCSGGAQGYFEAAIAAGADAYLTGEISEPQAHIARETGVAFLACGHHATEKFGAAALGGAASQALGIEHIFIDIDNPA
jgi:dinuclear metal center YbgI/SA1388 family protein